MVASYVTNTRGDPMHENANETLAVVAKSSPPAIVTALHLGGLTLADWVAILTILYLALQIGLLIPRYLDKWRGWRSRRKAAREVQ